MKFSYIAHFIEFKKLSIAICNLYKEEGQTMETENLTDNTHTHILSHQTATSSLKVNENPPHGEIGGKLACLKLDSTRREKNNLPPGIQTRSRYSHRFWSEFTLSMWFKKQKGFNLDHLTWSNFRLVGPQMTGSSKCKSSSEDSILRTLDSKMHPNFTFKK